MAFNDKPVKSIKAKLKSNNTLLRMKAVLSSILVYGIDKNYLNKNCTEKVRIKAASNQIE